MAPKGRTETEPQTRLPALPPGGAFRAAQEAQTRGPRPRTNLASTYADQSAMVDGLHGRHAGNGPEFTSRAVDAWAYHRGVRLSSSRRGVRSRTLTSIASTEGFATSASTSTGFSASARCGQRRSDRDRLQPRAATQLALPSHAGGVCSEERDPNNSALRRVEVATGRPPLGATTLGFPIRRPASRERRSEKPR
jgi:hypothetical protein